MHLHGLVPVALRGKIPEFLSGWKAIFSAVQCAMRPAPSDAPAGWIVFGRVTWAAGMRVSLTIDRAA
jgi:hypothetical protein